MVSHWSLSDSMSPQVSRTLLSILTDLYNAVVWIVTTRPLISKSSNPCINSLVTIPRPPIIFSITVTFMFHIFPFSDKDEVLIFLLVFFQFFSVVNQNRKFYNFASSLFLVDKLWSSGRD